MEIARSAYSGDQLDEYLERIQIPSHFRRAASPKPDLELLAAVQRYHLSHIPFEGVQLHYAPSPDILLDPQDIFKKFIKRGHGGYCMEHNCLLTHMLRTMGFKCYNTGARPQRRTDGIPNGTWYGWTHMVVIVRLENSMRYVVDVGFGGDGAIQPLRLVEDEVTQNLGIQEMRLTKGNIGLYTDPEQWIWIYQTRNGRDKPWQSNYCFPEIEFLPQDYGVMSRWTSTHPESFLTHTITAVRMLMRDGEIYGKIMLVGAEVRQNTGGRTETLFECKTERERVDVLEKHFGIVLNAEERNAIKGKKSEILST